jgi:hypothetical protein
MFLEIKRDHRTGKINSYKLVTHEEIIEAHLGNADLAAWSGGARLGSRFSLTTSVQRLIYVRTDVIDEEMIKRLEL